MTENQIYVIRCKDCNTKIETIDQRMKNMIDKAISGNYYCSFCGEYKNLQQIKIVPKNKKKKEFNNFTSMPVLNLLRKKQSKRRK